MPAAIARRWSSHVGVAALLTVLVLPASAGPSPTVGTVPVDLPGDVQRLGANLTEIAQAEDLETARAAHARAQQVAPNVLPHVQDLAPRDGELLATLLDELETALARGNLSDARSLAQAASNTLEKDLAPAVDRWSGNRTAIAASPLRWSGERVVVPVLLVNPPPGGIGAFDVTLTTDATPTTAQIATGQGESTVDSANGTARWASFDADALANLETNRRDHVVLGEVGFEPGTLAPGDRVELDVSVDALADPRGDAVLALGLGGSTTVPESTETGSLLGQGWLPVAGVVLGAGALIVLAHRLEV